MLSVNFKNDTKTVFSKQFPPSAIFSLISENKLSSFNLSESNKKGATFYSAAHRTS